MRQKFVITRYGKHKTLKISEYANIGNNRKRRAGFAKERLRYSFMCEETYENDLIERSISRGMNHLVAALRTRNMFPVRPFAVEIAESVMALYRASEDGPVELIFDDVDLVPPP